MTSKAPSWSLESTITNCNNLSNDNAALTERESLLKRVSTSMILIHLVKGFFYVREKFELQSLVNELFFVREKFYMQSFVNELFSIKEKFKVQSLVNEFFSVREKFDM